MTFHQHRFFRNIIHIFIIIVVVVVTSGVLSFPLTLLFFFVLSLQNDSGEENSFFLIISENVGQERNSQLCFALRGLVEPEYRSGSSGSLLSLLLFYSPLQPLVSLFIAVITVGPEINVNPLKRKKTTQINRNTSKFLGKKKQQPLARMKKQKVCDVCWKVFSNVYIEV